jgi:hypothetical protein
MQKIKGIFALISILFREKASTPGKQQRSRSGNERKQAFNAARPEAVEQYTEQGLKQCEREKIDAGQESKIRGSEAKRPHQIRCNDGVHVAGEIGEEIAASERSKNREQQDSPLRRSGLPACTDISHIGRDLPQPGSARNPILPAAIVCSGSENSVPRRYLYASMFFLFIDKKSLFY